ncbi:unnamed protein product [Toxocara canis]|uniref:Ion_trans domain-containing protein n=1 Tax=Toxocara canis TaxID=6265 RepID=A0A183UUX6_TOXCA|nr:unnamed protein product [Toxocara canis]
MLGRTKESHPILARYPKIGGLLFMTAYRGLEAIEIFTIMLCNLLISFLLVQTTQLDGTLASFPLIKELAFAHLFRPARNLNLLASPQYLAILERRKEVLRQQQHRQLHMEPQDILKFLQTGDMMLRPNNLLLSAINGYTKKDQENFGEREESTVDAVDSPAYGNLPYLSEGTKNRIQHLKSALTRANQLGWIW